MLRDAFIRGFDAAWVISNDSDLKAPIDVVRNELHLTVGVVIPNATIRRSALPADSYRRIRQGVLAASQFPLQLTDPNGTIHKPPTW